MQPDDPGPKAPEAPKRFTLTEAHANQRLDRFLAERLGCGRKQVARLFAEGLVRVDGRKVPKSHLARAGAEIEVQMRGSETVLPENAALDVRFEAPDLVVVLKPAGIPCAPLHPEELGTLANALVARFPEMLGVGYRPREPGIIHRLDTHTSGLLVAARTPEAFEVLRDALRAGKLTKKYLAIVSGRLEQDEGLLERPLMPDPKGGRRVSIADPTTPGARPAATYYRVVERKSHWSLLELSASRAYRHQIRVHLASLGHPIAGDPLYGGEPSPLLEGHHALHASYMACSVEGASSFEVEAALPETFRRLLDA